MPYRNIRLSREAIRPANRSARVHSKDQIQKAVRLMRKQGIVTPLIVDEDHIIIDGHLRYAVAEILEIHELNCIEVRGLSRGQKLELGLSLNRLPEDTKWNTEVLKDQLNLLIEMQFDLTFTGFAPAEVTQALAFQILPELPEEDLGRPDTPVTRPGDIWKVGSHYIACGEAAHIEAVWTQLSLPPARLLVTDPPYNVPTSGHIRATPGHRDFAMAAGEMSDLEFTSFLTTSLGACLPTLTEEALLYVCMDWRHLQHLTEATQVLLLRQQNLCVWAKANAGMGSFYRSQHELIGVYSRAETYMNNIELGRHGRYRTNVWTYPGGNSFSATRQEDLADHPTVKPTALIADIILDCTAHGDWVIDPFLGSGTCVLAAEQTGRHCLGIELDPAYVDVALRRLKDRLNLEATHLATGKTFDALKRDRLLIEEVVHG